MKYFYCKAILTLASFIGLLFMYIYSPSIASAQVATVAIWDTTFADATGGKVETSLGDFDDEITDFYVYFGSKISVCGKVGTSDTLLKKLGMIRLMPDGTFDSTFGTNGKAVFTWGVSDYPNRMFMEPDGSVIMSGASGLTALAADQVPAVFHISNIGRPDSSFGIDGRTILRYDTSSSGEFTNIFSYGVDFDACGSIAANNANGSSGFYAVRFDSTGKLVTTYGTNGKGFIPAQVHSASGFLSANFYTVFCGVANISGQPTVVLGRLTPFGKPDSTFGVNGLKSTGIVLTAGDDVTATVQQDYKLLIALPLLGPSQTIPFTLARFTTDGDIDSTYGTSGFSTIPIAPVAMSRGLNIANNGETVINGSAGTSLTRCATARIKQNGTPDSVFSRIGMDVVDVDRGVYSNYLIQFNAIGAKHYIGIGGTMQNGKLEFLVARFRDDTVSSSSSIKISSSKEGEFSIYPNPASSEVTIESGLPSFENIKIIDALGRDVTIPEIWRQSMNSATCSIYVSDLPDGVYYCITDSDDSRSIQKLIVAH